MNTRARKRRGGGSAGRGVGGAAAAGGGGEALPRSRRMVKGMGAAGGGQTRDGPAATRGRGSGKLYVEATLGSSRLLPCVDICTTTQGRYRTVC